MLSERTRRGPRRRRPRERLPTLYLVAPESLASWFSSFVDHAADDVILFTGEGEGTAPDAVLQLLDDGVGRTTLLLSSHETLARDHALAARLRGRGYDALGPSRTSVRLGTDKCAMKKFFDRHGFRTPPWAPAGRERGLADPNALVVVKRRSGTQSAGTRLARLGDCALGADELCELYADGVEYSLIVYRDERRELVFPPIWKGCTSIALVPPWRRLRVCPDPALPAECERALRASSRAIAAAADVCGFVEIEYLVTPSGELHVLEINPRIAGTMRLAAMATGVKIFSLHKLDLCGDLRASCYAAEVPYAGPAFRDERERVFATSRVTASGETIAVVRRKIERALGRRTRESVALARVERVNGVRSSVHHFGLEPWLV